MATHTLRTHFLTVRPGPIDDSKAIERRLADCWDQIDGSAAGGMTASKLLGRIEDLSWHPPHLTFTIERHGGTVLGSSRAERQRWDVNLETSTAVCSRPGHRQLTPMAPRLDVRPLARATVASILGRQPAEGLRWARDGTVRVQIGCIIPTGSAVGPTLAGCRRRFWKALDDELIHAGWTQVRHSVYRRPACAPQQLDTHGSAPRFVIPVVGRSPKLS
jgi:hypothetical protein